MVSVQVFRPGAPGLRHAAETVAGAARTHDGFESLADAVWRDLDTPGNASAGIVATEADRPVGYAHVAASDTEADPHLVAGLVVAPDRRDDAVVARALLDGLTAHVAHTGGGRVVLWATGADATLDAALLDAGFHRVGEHFQMRVPLPLAEPAAWPAGVSVRTFRPGADDVDWLRVNNRAFAEHPDQGGWNEATLQRRIAEPWFDPAGFLLAIDGDGLAGFCWTKVHEASDDDPRLGEIYVIGVDPARHGTGLGRALTLAGLDHLATARACPVGMLYVDGTNAAALGLYRALGFREHRVDRAYEADVAAA